MRPPYPDWRCAPTCLPYRLARLDLFFCFSVSLPGLIGLEVEFRGRDDLFLTQGHIDVGANLSIIGREVDTQGVLVTVAAHQRHDRDVLIHAGGFGGLAKADDLANIDLAVVHHQHGVFVLLQGQAEQQVVQGAVFQNILDDEYVRVPSTETQAEMQMAQHLQQPG